MAHGTTYIFDFPALKRVLAKHDVRVMCRLLFRGGKQNGAMDAIRFNRERRLRIKLIWQDPLNQLSSLPAAFGLSTQAQHLHAAFWRFYVCSSLLEQTFYERNPFDDYTHRGPMKPNLLD